MFSKSSTAYYYIILGFSATGDIWNNESNYSMENFAGWITEFRKVMF